jgi:hypothetical protein
MMSNRKHGALATGDVYIALAFQDGVDGWLGQQP